MDKETFAAEEFRAGVVKENLTKQLPTGYDFDLTTIVNQLMMSSSVEEQELMMHAVMSKETVNHLYNTVISRSRLGGGSDEYPVGLAITGFLTSQKLQETLNVKRLGNNTEVGPKNIFNVLHTKTMDKYWIRICGLDVKEKINYCDHIALGNNYHEYYFDNKQDMLTNLKLLCDFEEVERVIFISDLRLAKEIFPPDVSYAMIFAFLACYWGQSNDIELRFKNQTALLYIQIQAYLFMYVNNIVNVPSDTPLNSTSTERASQKIEKIAKSGEEGVFYAISSPREFQNIGVSIGTGSRNNSEYIFPLEITQYIENLTDSDTSRENISNFLAKMREEMVKRELEVNSRVVKQKQDFDLEKFAKKQAK